MADVTLFTTGDVARRAGCSREAIHAAERAGRIPAPLRAANGLRLFTPEQVETVVSVVGRRTREQAAAT